MKNRSRLRRGAAVTFAAAFGAAALPAASSATYVAQTCAFSKKAFTVGFSYGFPKAYRPGPEAAIADWSNRTKVDITLVASGAPADVTISWYSLDYVFPGAPGNATALGRMSAPCPSNGTAWIVVDADNSPAYQHTQGQMTAVVAHELGHVLGLADNNQTNGFCEAKEGSVTVRRTRPANLMSPAGFVGNQTCGPMFATQGEVDAVNALYK